MSHNKNNKFSVEVTSVPDRDGLVAEIWLDQELLAELRDERGSLHMQIYPAPEGQPWDVPYEAFSRALQQARDRLRTLAP
jgi:hypothetical protein